MTFSPIEHAPALAQSVQASSDTLTVDLADGRSISVPLDWYPRLAHATENERNHWQLIGRGEGVHWPDIDEDISVSGVLNGLRSGESRQSFERWLQSRESGG